MVYVVIGIVGLLAVVTGVVLGVLGYDMGGSIVGASGGILTAVGLIGFGLSRRREKRPSGSTGRPNEAAERDLAEVLDSITHLLVERGYGRSPGVAPQPAATLGRRRIGRAEFEAAIRTALSPNLVEDLMRVQREQGELSPEEISRYFIEQRELVARNAAGLKRLSELDADAETLADVASAGPDQQALAKAIEVLLRRLETGRTASLAGDLTARPLRANPEVAEEVIKAAWDATCEPASETSSEPFGRGVVLSIEGKEVDERDLRCVVTAPDGARYESTRRVDGFRFPSSDDTPHWPGEFRPKPQEPWAPGHYSYTWIGDTPDIIATRSEVLARRFFHVNDDGIITCHGEVAPSEERRWTATHELRRDPKYGPGATLSIRSTGEKFGHFICRVTNPTGAVVTASPRTGGYLIPAVARTEAAVHYPGQFKRAVPMMPPGRYFVEWYGLTGIRPDDARVLLARITFDLPEGYRFA